MKLRIITDSAADLLPDIKSRVTVIPMTVRFGKCEYLDGVTLTHKEFYEHLIESDELPTTSQIPPQTFADVFESVTAAGETAIVITVSSKLSGTYQSACIAASDFPGKVYMLDSLSLAIGQGILVEYALRLADSGMDAEGIIDELNRARNDICLVAMLDTLEYLKRGGRISKTAAFAGGVLSIKPVIGIVDGEVKILGKARGSRQANNLLISEIEKGGIDFSKPVLLGYTGISDTLLCKYIEDSSSVWEGKIDSPEYTTIGSAIGTHAGPGAIAVAFFREKK